MGSLTKIGTKATNTTGTPESYSAGGGTLTKIVPSDTTGAPKSYSVGGGTLTKIVPSAGASAAVAAPAVELPTLPQKEDHSFLETQGYGWGKIGVGVLGALESANDFIGTAFYKGLQGAAELAKSTPFYQNWVAGELEKQANAPGGGRVTNPDADSALSKFSDWAGEKADSYLENSVTRDLDESLEEKYQPSEEMKMAGALNETVAQMLPSIGVGSAVSKAGSALNAASQAAKGSNVSKALFGLQAAGGGASEAKAEGATTEQALFYGTASGILETTIEGIAGGIPGMGEGKIKKVAGILGSNPVVSKVLDIAGEGGEEGLSAFITPYLKRAIYDKNAPNATAEEIAQNVIMGMAAAGVLQAGIELPSFIGNKVSTLPMVGQNAPADTTAAQADILQEGQGVGTSMQNAVTEAVEGRLPGVAEQKNTASTGETGNKGETASVVQGLKKSIPSLAEMAPVSTVSSQTVQAADGRTMAEEVVDSNGNIIKIGSEEGANLTSLAENIGAGTQSSLPSDHTVLQQEQGVKNEYTTEQGTQFGETQQTETISDIRRSGTIVGVNTEIIDQAERIAQATGKKILFYRASATGSGMENGYYDSASGVIWINANSKKPMAQILSHEMTHSVEFTQAYQELSAFVLTHIQQTGGDLQQMRQAKRDLYAQNNAELKSSADADAEIVAEYVAEHLLTDEQSIVEMVQYNPSLGRRILDWLNDLMAKMGFSGAQERAFIAQVTSLYNQALKRSNAGFGMDPAAMAKQMQNAYAENDMTEQEYDDALDLVMQEESLAGRSMLGIWDLDNGGRQYSINKTRGLSLQDQMKEYRAGQFTKHDEFYYGNAPAVLDAAGFGGRPLVMSQTDYQKSKNVKHNVPLRAMNRLAESISDPILSFEDGNRVGVLTKDIDGDGKPLLAGVQTNTELDGETVNRIKSAYGLDNPQAWIGNQIQQGKVLRVYDIERAEKFLDGFGYKAERPEHFRSGDIISATPKPVNTQFSISEPAAGQMVEELLPDVDPVSTMPSKAQEYLKRAEQSLANQIAAKLSVPKHVQRSFLKPVVRDISNEYLRTGKVGQETIDSTFEQAYREGIVVDTEFYDQYKHIKNYLRTTKLNISDTIKSDIADFNSFRKSAFGTLNMAQGGIGVDTAYGELSGMAPALFPESITNQSDQLLQMFEVGRSIRIAEKSLDEYYGQEAEEFKRFAKQDYEAAVNDTLAQLRLAKRYSEDREAGDTKPVTVEEVQEAYPKLKDARRKYEKTTAKNLLTEEDVRQVGRLMRGDIDESDLDPVKDNVGGIMAVYQAKQEYEQYARRIRKWNQEREAKLREKADGYLNTALSWKDKKTGIQYSRETMERNIRDIVPDRATADAVIKEYFTPVHDSQAAATRTKNNYRERVKALDLARKTTKGNEVSEAHAVQLLGEAEDNIRMLEQSRGRMKTRDGKTLQEWRTVVDNLWAQNPNLDESKVRSAVEEFRNIYDELFTQMNTVRVRNGYEPINYRSGYFPHFQPGDGDGIMVQFGKALGIDTAVTALPTTINGLTHTFKPGIQWFGNAQERLGFDTAYDAVEGFDKYIEGCADVIHQTDNIQNLRALASQMRYRTSDDGIRKQVNAVRADTTLSEEDKNNRIEKIYESGKFTLSNFVVELEEYTNLLANKKSRADRNMEQALGRNFYNWAKALESRVAANMVAVNPASWLTNFIPLTQGNATLDRGMLLKGMWDTLKAYKTDDGIVSKSTFLTNRRGSDPIVKTWSQKASATASKPMEWIDSFTADTLVRARYNQNRKNRKMSEQAAMEEADNWVAGVMADRSKGSTPTLFNRSNPFTKVFTQFQLEVNNQLSYLFKDLPDEAKKKGGAALAGMLIKFILGAYLYDEIYEYFIGRRPALDPLGILNDTVGDLTGYELPNLVEAGVDLLQGEKPSFKTEKVGAYEALSNTGTALVEELPFIGGVLGGGRVPISSALPDVANLARAATDNGWSAEKRGATAIKELANPATYLVLPFGGGQIKKAAQGIRAVVEGGSYSVDSEGNDLLQYPVYSDTPWETVKSAAGAVLFGKTTLPTGREWIESGFKTLSAKETKAYKNMREAGIGERDAYELIKALKSAEGIDAKRDAMEASEVSDDGKDILYYNVLATDKECALMDELSELSEDARPLYDTLMYFKECSLQAEKLAAVSSGNYSDGDIRELAGFVMGTELKTEKGSDTEYAKLLKAMDTALSAEDAVQMKADGLNLDQFLEFEAAGMDAKAARDLLEKLEKLTPASGSDSVTNLQKYRAVVDSGVSEQDQLDALGVMMTESEFGKLQVGYDYGVAPDVYVGYKETASKYDADGNGSYTQAETRAAIDAMGIDDVGMKAALWQLANKSWKPTKNPYSVSIGQKVYDAMHSEG